MEQRKEGNVGRSLVCALFPGRFQFIFLLRNWVLKSHFSKGRLDEKSCFFHGYLLGLKRKTAKGPTSQMVYKAHTWLCLLLVYIYSSKPTLREITLQLLLQTFYFSAFSNSAHISTVTMATTMSGTGSSDLHDLQGVSLA